MNNETILKTRLELFNAVQGPRVGDFLQLTPPDPRCQDYTRFTHDWGDTMQTGGSAYGAYYLSHGCLSYSGGLDPGLPVVDLIQTPETRLGRVWFFDGDIQGARRGVNFEVPMRVFVPRPGADLKGIYELDCPYWLAVLSEEQHKRTCGYWYTVTKQTMAHTAFRTKPELLEWLTKERLALTEGIESPGHQFLAFARA